MTSSNPQMVGAVGGAAIVAELGNGFGTAGTVRVTLTSDYVMVCPPGYPERETPGSGAGAFPHAITAGTTANFQKPEADALVAAGAAVYA